MERKSLTTWVLMIVCTLPLLASGGDFPLPGTLSAGHPRLMAGNVDKKQIQKLVTTDAWAGGIYDATVKSIAPYVERHKTDPQWIVSRLQMYWTGHCTNVYINGGKYAYADGRAPVPTVRFPGARDNTTPYAVPAIEDITPYMDDARGLYLQNTKKEGRPWEWADQSNTGTIIEAINRRIMQLAEKAAFVYWYTGDEAYARFAFDLFDTYMMGIYHRNVPVDLSHGHHQTLVGFSSFEVIHENVLDELTLCYDFLHPYIVKNAGDKLATYGATFQKWADQIVANGVTFNNWNLHQAIFIARIAIVLDNDADYANGHGCRHYLDIVLNKGGERQWSLKRLLDEGYDANTGIWNESPGYASGMVNDFLKFVELYDRYFHIDLVPYMPVLPKASLALPQYLYPNRHMVAFGDGYYKKLSAESMEKLIVNAQRYGKTEQEEVFTALYKAVVGPGYKAQRTGSTFHALFDGEPLKLRDDVAAANLSDYQTATFSAPNVSWVMQRNGSDAQNGLAVSLAGSLGNHCHANGIAMELYGKGLPLAPEMGIGTSYFQTDYAEYYSQFPAHNTVVVDGKSSYPVMKGNHAFSVNALYPPSGARSGFVPGYSFADVSFLEPETFADQKRVTGIVRTSENSGYYIDIFRSRKRNGGDVKHDYVYHNMGQTLSIVRADGRDLSFAPTSKLGFADNDLMAYDYFWNKQVAAADNDVKGQFALALSSGQKANMNFWAKGDAHREIYSMLSPVSKACRGGAMGLGEQWEMPVPAMVIRQSGQAWNRPFVAVYEPSDGSETNAVKGVSYFGSSTADSTFVGVMVESSLGRKDYILSSATGIENKYNNISMTGLYGIVTETDNTTTLFLGSGQCISAKGIALQGTVANGNAAVALNGNRVALASGSPFSLSLPDTFGKGAVVLKTKAGQWPGKRVKTKAGKVVVFDLPAMDWAQGEVVGVLGAN